MYNPQRPDSNDCSWDSGDQEEENLSQVHLPWCWLGSAVGHELWTAYGPRARQSKEKVFQRWVLGTWRKLWQCIWCQTTSTCSGLKRKPLALIKRLRKAKKEAPPLEKPAVVKTHLRNMIVVPEMIGSVVGIYNGKVFNQIEVKVRSIIYIIPCPCQRPLFTVRNAARDGRPLPWWVLHHIQASEARETWYWGNTLIQVHTTQVNISCWTQCSLCASVFFQSAMLIRLKHIVVTWW